ncbi:MAG: DUF4476 domain-containing protein [Cyclobacteriaceae bacterium]|nr:DUF4476 domain-containing protein [Cyclobacteriaceae bacterium]
MKRLILVLCMLIIGQHAFSKDRLCCGELFPMGSVLTSPNGKFFLVFQDDRNLVLYKRDGGADKPLWATATNGKVNKCVMQADGNLVLYSGPVAVWSSNTYGNPNAMLVVQDDGNMVIYAGTKAIWATNTAEAPADRICCGQEFPMGSVLNSANGKYFLVFQDDRNLVLYKRTGGADVALWATATNGKVNKCVMQADGNLVLYNTNSAVWSSNTYGNPNAVLVVQNDGNMVIYVGNRSIWATNTAQQEIVEPVQEFVQPVRVEPEPIAQTVASSCEVPETQYNAMVSAIDAQAFRDSKMSIAKQAIKNKCLSLDQVRSLSKLFSFEDQTLEFIKYAYDFTNDKSEYYTLADIFSFKSNVTKFNEFLNTK